MTETVVGYMRRVFRGYRRSLAVILKFDCVTKWALLVP
jgi:hypothetical protein